MNHIHYIVTYLILHRVVPNTVTYLGKEILKGITLTLFSTLWASSVFMLSYLNPRNYQGPYQEYQYLGQGHGYEEGQSQLKRYDSLDFMTIEEEDDYIFIEKICDKNSDKKD